MTGSRTLCEAVGFHGRGLHSGNDCSVTIRPSDLPCISFLDQGRAVPLDSLQADGTGRGTTVSLPGGRQIMTVEHLLGVLSGLSLWHVSIEVEGPEIPSMDGSGRPMAEELEKRAFPAPDGGPEPLQVTVPVVVGDSGRGAFVVAYPAREKRVTSVIRYDGTVPQTQSAEYRHSPGTFLRDIAPARTFVLEREIEGILSRGLGRGGSLENTLILGEKGPAVPQRFPDEAPRHKILDLFGDLALIGRPLKGHVFSYKGGHALNLRLVERLRRVAGTD